MSPLNSVEKALIEITQLSNYNSENLYHLIKNGDFDMNEFIKLNEQNSTYILSSQRLSQICEKIPERNTQFQNYFHKKIELFNEYSPKREKWLEKIIQNCSENNLPLILLKGSMIGVTLAPSFSYKKMNDIDILIKPEDGPRFLKVIESIGFQSVGALFSENNFSENNYHTPPYYSPDMSCLLGIHWQLCSPYAKWRPQLSDIWNDCKAITFGNNNCFRMSWEHNLIHMCIHLPLFKTGPRELQDIAEIIKRNEIDWDKVYAYTIKWKAYAPVYRVLYLTSLFLPKNIIMSELLDKLVPQISTWLKTETHLRKKKLLHSRSTYIAKIEKAYSISILSKDPKEKLQAWALTWYWTFFPKKSQLGALVIGGSYFIKRLKAPIYIMRAMAMDYGFKLFTIMTVINIMRATKSLVKLLFLQKNERITDSEVFKIYLMLE